MATLRSKIAEIDESDSQAHVSFNHAIRWLHAMVVGHAISISLNTPPGSPNDDDMYRVGASPTGDWSGHAGELALYNSDGWGTNGWDFVTPEEGMRIWDGGNNDLLVYDGTAWQTAFNGT